MENFVAILSDLKKIRKILYLQPSYIKITTREASQQLLDQTIAKIVTTNRKLSVI